MHWLAASKQAQLSKAETPHKLKIDGMRTSHYMGGVADSLAGLDDVSLDMTIFANASSPHSSLFRTQYRLYCPDGDR